MANIKSAIKRARQNVKRNALKSSQRASTRTAVKAVDNAIEAKDKNLAKEAFNKAEKTLDSMASKKIITKNKASRTKSRLNKRIKAL
ncbi:MAG: 30S ribosomal protein S20 [Gammaproteobacteria bacterium]|jgi:small subunit ribosomal protein S20|nr:MAG: 30S ribosomal protein S20 [Gammaproteobacteria bacterium]